jgi:hypothetical protein
MNSYRLRTFAISPFGLVLLLNLTACGPEASSSQTTQSSTSTPISANVPKADTPSPAPAFPTVTGDDLDLIAQAITNTSVANLKSFHFMMTETSPLLPNTITEGDFVQPDGTYMKLTQGDYIEETLTLGNSSYCRDSTGKWIVVAADLRANFAQSEATAQARMNEEMKKYGFTGTPQPVPTIDYDNYREMSRNQLAAYGPIDSSTYAFSYAGEEAVESVTTKRYVGEFSWQKLTATALPPNADGTPIPPEEATALANAAPEPQLRETLTLWIDPSSRFVRKLESVFPISPDSMVAYFYRYGCGVDPHSQLTPTRGPMPQSGSMVTTLVYTRLNDPSITLPKP